MWLLVAIGLAIAARILLQVLRPRRDPLGKALASEFGLRPGTPAGQQAGSDRALNGLLSLLTAATCVGIALLAGRVAAWAAWAHGLGAPYYVASGMLVLFALLGLLAFIRAVTELAHAPVTEPWSRPTSPSAGDEPAHEAQPVRPVRRGAQLGALVGILVLGAGIYFVASPACACVSPEEKVRLSGLHALHSAISGVVREQQAFLAQHRRYARTLAELGHDVDVVELRLTEVQDSSFRIEGASLPLGVTCVLTVTPRTTDDARQTCSGRANRR